jgi:hypothetical protein
LRSLGLAFRPAPVCHISHHPLDGSSPHEHACPLLIATASFPSDHAPPRAQLRPTSPSPSD